MIVSPASGQGTSQILKISHPSSASPGQLQSIAQTLITAKSSDGSIVHLRPAPPGKSQSSNMTLGSVQATKTIAAAVKRAAQPRNVYTKMIISGNQTQPAQELLLASTQDNHQGQTIKFLTSNATSQSTSNTKTITFAQAQQMGLISNKVQQGSFTQHILPANTTKGVKLLQSTSQPPKLTLIPSSAVKPPAKILPAPATTTAVRPTFSNAIKTAQQSPQKVIIRQSALKPGTVLGSGQIIRIPANQNIASNQVHQIQMPGRQVQYVRLVSNAASTTTNVMTVGKAKMPSTLQSMGVGQKIAGPQQIVKVVPLNTGTQQLRAVVPKQTISSGNSQRVLIPSANAGKNTVAIPASALTQLTSGQAVLSTNSNVGNIVVLPAQYLQQQQQTQAQIQQNSDEAKAKSNASTASVMSTQSSSTPSSANLSALTSTESPKIIKSSSTNADANGIRPRKPCNCTKSQCLKL